MYAIIELGGKQHKVSPGDVVEVDRLCGVKEDKLEVSEVLLISGDSQELRIGQPYVKDAKVKASILSSYKGKKTVAFKYRRRKSYHFKKGHRSDLMKVKIEEITLN